MGREGCDWDDQKHAENLLKHRVRFEDACCVFDDPYYIELFEDLEDDEDRWRVTGRVGEIVLSETDHFRNKSRATRKERLLCTVQRVATKVLPHKVCQPGRKLTGNT